MTRSVLFALLLAIPSAEARTWIVAADGSGDAIYIHDAIFYATRGDTVLVKPGHYPGYVELYTQIDLIAEAGPGETFLTSGDFCIENRAVGWSIIQGFTLTGRTAVISSSGATEVRDCVIVGSSLGVAVTESGLTRIRDTVFSSNVRALRSEGRSLLVEGCTFEAHDEGLAEIHSGELRFVDNIVRDNTCANVRIHSGDLRFLGNVVRDNHRADFFLEPDDPSAPVEAVIESNLFVANTSCWIRADVAVVRQNTWVGNRTYLLGGSSVTMEYNLFTASDWGLRLWARDGQPLIRCNNVWGNTTNWWGLPDPTGVDGNMSEAPLLCDAAGAGFTVAANSPCLPANNECHVQIGAFGQGCETVSVKDRSWGRIKDAYR